MRRSAALGLCCVAILALTLWPRAPRSPNRLDWDAPAGLAFAVASQLIADAPLRLGGPDFTLRLALVLEPSDERSNRPIVTLGDGRETAALAIGQWRRGLYFSTRSTNPSGDPRDDHYVNLPALSGPASVVVIGDADHVRLFVDQEELLSAPVIDPGGTDLVGTLVLGCLGPRLPHWSGVIRELTLYGAVLSPSSLVAGADLPTPLAQYLFTDSSQDTLTSHVAGAPTLQAEPEVRAAFRGWLDYSPPISVSGEWLLSEVLLNVAGFIPLGWLVALRVSRRRVWAAVVAGVVLSLLVETLQLEIPGRSSSAIDLLCNGLGAGIGGVLAVFLRSRRALGTA